MLRSWEDLVELEQKRLELLKERVGLEAAEDEGRKSGNGEVRR